MENTSAAVCALNEDKKEYWIEIVDRLFIITIFLLLLATIAWFVKLRIGG